MFSKEEAAQIKKEHLLNFRKQSANMVEESALVYKGFKIF